MRIRHRAGSMCGRSRCEAEPARSKAGSVSLSTSTRAAPLPICCGRSRWRQSGSARSLNPFTKPRQSASPCLTRWSSATSASTTSWRERLGGPRSRSSGGRCWRSFPAWRRSANCSGRSRQESRCATALLRASRSVSQACCGVGM